MSQHTTTSTGPTSARRPGRAANITLWVIQVLLAAVYVFAAIPKITLEPIAVEGFAAIGFSPAGTVVIGCLEIAAAIGLLVPRLNGITALCCVALMIGAVTFTVAFMGAAMAALPFVVGVLAAVVAYKRWYRTVELAGWIRSLTTG